MNYLFIIYEKRSENALMLNCMMITRYVMDNDYHQPTNKFIAINIIVFFLFALKIHVVHNNINEIINVTNRYFSY